MERRRQVIAIGLYCGICGHYKISIGFELNLKHNDLWEHMKSNHEGVHKRKLRDLIQASYLHSEEEIVEFREIMRNCQLRKR